MNPVEIKFPQNETFYILKKEVGGETIFTIGSLQPNQVMSSGLDHSEEFSDKEVFRLRCIELGLEQQYKDVFEMHDPVEEVYE